MTLEFDGKVFATLPLQHGMGQRGPWSRATVVFEVQDGRYTQKIACENTNSAEKFASLQIGQIVHVKADVTSREYNGKWFTSVLCYEFLVQNQNQQQYTPPVAGATCGPF